MKKINIYWFSGTGNSFRIAEIINTEFLNNNCDSKMISMTSTKLVNMDMGDMIGLVFPVAVQSTYPLVWEFFNNMPKVNGAKIFMADTMAGGSGGIVGPLKKVLMTKGYDCIGAKEFIMPSSMASKVDNNKDEKIKKSETLAKEYAIDLLNGKTSWNRIPGASDVMRSMSKPKAIWTKMASTLKVDNNICIKCGLCVEVCPVGSISMDVNGFPKNDKRCNSCLRCLSYCPVNAYEFTGKKIVQNKTVDIKQLID